VLYFTVWVGTYEGQTISGETENIAGWHQAAVGRSAYNWRKWQRTNIPGYAAREHQLL